MGHRVKLDVARFATPFLTEFLCIGVNGFGFGPGAFSIGRVRTVSSSLCNVTETTAYGEVFLVPN